MSVNHWLQATHPTGKGESRPPEASRQGGHQPRAMGEGPPLTAPPAFSAAPVLCPLLPSSGPGFPSAQLRHSVQTAGRPQAPADKASQGLRLRRRPGPPVLEAELPSAELGASPGSWRRCPAAAPRERGPSHSHNTSGEKTQRTSGEKTAGSLTTWPGAGPAAHGQASLTPWGTSLSFWTRAISCPPQTGPSLPVPTPGQGYSKAPECGWAQRHQPGVQVLPRPLRPQDPPLH